MDHPCNKSLFDNDDSAFHVPFVRTDVLSSQHRASLQGEVACPDCRMSKKPARSVFVEGDRFIHHVLRQHSPLSKQEDFL
jgi:hypothetical protein